MDDLTRDGLEGDVARFGTYRGRRFGLRLSVVTGVGLLGLATGAAFAETVWNSVPNANYAPSCYDTTAGNGSPCRTDNATVYYYADSAGENKLEAADKATVIEVLTGEYGPTHLTLIYDDTPVFSGAGETDIIYQEGSAGISSDADGVYWCNARGNVAFLCDQGYVRIRGGGHYNPGLICHETGHAVGLTHGNNADPWVGQQDSRLACMKKSVGSGTPLGPNNKTNINFWY